MAQLVSRAEPHLPQDVSTVAELLRRNTPTGPALDTTSISVGSLLRREGRAPHCVDRPVQPRTHHQRVAEPDGGPRISGTVVRRAAVAAGTLLAASSVFGAAMLIDTSAGPDASQARDGSTPGRDVLDGHPGKRRRTAGLPHDSHPARYLDIRCDDSPVGSRAPTVRCPD